MLWALPFSQSSAALPGLDCLISRRTSMLFHFNRKRLLCVVGTYVLGSVMGAPAASAQDDPLHIWVGKLNAANAEKWVNGHLEQEKKDIDTLLAVKGART